MAKLFLIAVVIGVVALSAAAHYATHSGGPPSDDAACRKCCLDRHCSTGWCYEGYCTCRGPNAGCYMNNCNADAGLCAREDFHSIIE